MRRRSIFLALLVALGAGALAHHGLGQRSAPHAAPPVAGRPADDVSRAMTFTRPAEPAK